MINSLQTPNIIDTLMCNFKYFEREHLSNILVCNR